jgi:hypothetical protein
VQLGYKISLRAEGHGRLRGTTCELRAGHALEPDCTRGRHVAIVQVVVACRTVDETSRCFKSAWQLRLDNTLVRAASSGGASTKPHLIRATIFPFFHPFSESARTLAS